MQAPAQSGPLSALRGGLVFCRDDPFLTDPRTAFVHEPDGLVICRGGTIEVGAVHGRLLTAWSAAGIAGPLIVNGLADMETSNGKSGADLYTISLLIMVGVLVVGFIANLGIGPVDSRFHERASEATADEPRFSRDGEPVRPSPVRGTTTTGSHS